MAKTIVVDFRKALNATDDGKKRHVLLGNGFSRAWRDDIFSYQALYDQAEMSGLSKDARKAFEALDTTDFEQVMRMLKQAAKLARQYNRPKLADILDGHGDEIREVLVSTIADNHPERPHDVTARQYAACKRFLSHFDSVYTVNYDLLLYWALMQDEIEPFVECDDGFRQPDDGPAKYVTWDVQKTDKQKIHYLHGALHLFDAGSELQKYIWSNTQIALIDQIRKALKKDKYPLFVSEGSADSKMNRIQHSGYLNRSYRSFAKIGGSLFVYGLSMAENDEHILKLIDHGGFKNIAIGLYGPPTSPGNRRIIERAQAFGTMRKGPPPKIMYFDAQSAQVWG
ncbi:MAG: DUF4917 family protein [Phycisphaerales bacterium JB060]